MFYIKEIFQRSYYTCFSFSFTFFIFYLNKTELIFLLSYSIFSSETATSTKKLVTSHFIYTHPLELFLTQMVLVTYLTLLLNFFYYGNYSIF